MYSNKNNENILPFRTSRGNTNKHGMSHIGEIVHGVGEKRDRGTLDAFLHRRLQRNAQYREEEPAINPFDNAISDDEKKHFCPHCKQQVSASSPGYLRLPYPKKPIPCPMCYPVYKAKRDRFISTRYIKAMVDMGKFPNMQNIPVKKQDLRLQSYPINGDQSAKPMFEAFVKGRIKELVVVGSPGRGKTGLAIGAAQALTEQDVQVLVLPMTDYINLLLENNSHDGPNGYNKDVPKFNNHIKDIAKLVEVLIIDDMGVERSTESGNTVRETQELIECRHDNNLRTLITSNLTMDGLAEHWHLNKGDRTGFQDSDRLVSRIQSWYKFYTMDGPDLRYTR
jgi:DNA replication protein DnaC